MKKKTEIDILETTPKGLGPNFQDQWYDEPNKKTEQKFEDGCRRVVILAFCCIIGIVLIMVYVNSRGGGNL